MLNYIHEIHNPIEDEFNDAFITGADDTPIEDFVTMVMKDFESVENIEIVSVTTVRDMDEIDYNKHTININYKKKRLAEIEIPTHKFVTENRYMEMIFRVRIRTNLNQVTIDKPLLIPLADEDDGTYLINGKICKAIWQLCDANTYTQRGRVTYKSRMPIIVYQTRNRAVLDTDGQEWLFTSYSYALDTKSKRKGAKKKTKFINPMMIYAAKMGMRNAIKFFNLQGIIELTNEEDPKTKDLYTYFMMNEVYIKVPTVILRESELVQSVVCMLTYCANKDFPVNYHHLEDREYWICRIGYISSIKNTNILSFRDKGYTTVHMIERLFDQISKKDLRVPDIYKRNIYYVLFWMIMNFDALKSKNNLDMNNKRIRRNEYIVMASLGKKVSENINKLIEKKSKSKMNTMDTLLELFNFPSDIIMSGMKNLSDCVKSDEIVNDMNFLLDLMYTSKGPNSLGESSSKMIPAKYRYPHISQVGIIDPNVSSNSDPGMTGSFVPFVQLYDGLFFNPNHDPSEAEYRLVKAIHEMFKTRKEIFRQLPMLKSSDIAQIPTRVMKSYEAFVKYITEHKEEFQEELQYLPIRIVEKEPTTS